MRPCAGSRCMAVTSPRPMDDLLHEVHLADGHRICRTLSGRLMVDKEDWAPFLDRQALRLLVAARLAEVVAALSLVLARLSTHPSPESVDGLLDRYSLLREDRRLLRDFLAILDTAEDESPGAVP